MTAAVSETATALPVQSTADYPAVPFILGLERGSEFEEAVLCTAKTVTEFTVTRGYDGTPARAHALDAKAEHCPSALDFDESSAHINDSTRDDHPQYYNAARLHPARTEVWSGASLPTTGNFNGRIVFASGLTNTNFRNRTYVYRANEWRLLHPARFHTESITANFGGSANIIYDLLVLDLGAVPCAVNIKAEAVVQAYPQTNAGTIFSYIRNLANGDLCWSVKTTIADRICSLHIFRQIAYASGVSAYLKLSMKCDQPFVLSRDNAYGTPKFAAEVY